MKLFFKILGALATTGGVLFLAGLLILPLIDNDGEVLIIPILIGFFILWVFLMIKIFD